MPLVRAGPCALQGWAFFLEISILAIQKKFIPKRNFRRFSGGDPGRASVFRAILPQVLEIAQSNYTRKDVPIDGGIRTLSRIGRAFINILVVGAREFRCGAHTVDGLGDRLLPDDHTASRTAIQEPASGAQELATIQAWLSKHAVFCSALSVHKARGRAPLRCIAGHLDNAWR